LGQCFKACCGDATEEPPVEVVGVDDAEPLTVRLVSGSALLLPV
jgi:hypothetical protein